ncbi:MAG: FAD-dependent oxidoreductase, partial [Epsilonproteobacteria bacterium]
SVLLLDRSSVAASGGSGAAGAFVSPKIGKGSPLQELTNEAFEFAKDFYLQNFPKYFHQTSILRIPKDIDDAQKFPEYKKYNLSKYETIDSKTIRGFGIDEELDSFLFEEAGVCDAPGLTRAIWDQLPHEQFRVDELKHNGDCWVLSNTESSNRYRAENIILATGYQNDLLDMRYMGVRGTWGSRGDYYSSLPLSISMHKSISISANIDGIIKIGATHVKSQEPCLACKGEPLGKLFQTASKMVNTDDFRLKGTYCGMRAGSKDYFPLVGRVVDTQYMLEKYPAITRGSSPSLKYHKNLYICNGLGGRGFVFAPLMGKELAAHILSETTMDSRMDPDRLFLRWCRKDPSLRNNKK